MATGRALRMFTLVDSYTRECLAIEVDSCLSSRRVTRVLDWVIEQRGAPDAIRCDNGPEFTSRHFLAWCEDRKIGSVHIQPGRPMQNGYVESFNGRFRDECLNANWFATIDAMHDRRSRLGGTITTNSGHTVRWVTARRESLQQTWRRHRHERGFYSADWGKGIQTPSPCPRPPSPLTACYGEGLR